MSILRPSVMVAGIKDVTPELLGSLSVKGVLLDVDNTLACDMDAAPLSGVPEHLEGLRRAGFSLIIISNNVKERVSDFAQSLSLPYIHFAMKPLPFGYIRAARRLGLRLREMCIVGDQLFTDTLGGNLLGVTTILTSPVRMEMGFTFKIRRGLEEIFLKRYNKKK